MKRPPLVSTLLATVTGIALLIGCGLAQTADVGSNSAPQKDASGAYPLLVASMNAKDITEFKSGNVRTWGDPEEVTIDGARQWSIKLVCTSGTKFGYFDVDVTVYVKDGHVVKWIYTQSREPVP